MGDDFVLNKLKRLCDDYTQGLQDIDAEIKHKKKQLADLLEEKHKICIAVLMFEKEIKKIEGEKPLD
jgi:hypothetical protein